MSQNTKSDSIHNIYLTAKKSGNPQSLGVGESIINGSDSKIHIKSCKSTLDKRDASDCPVVAEFLSFTKNDRSNGTALGSMTLSDGRIVEVFMMTLNNDEDYLRCNLLFRCHALLRIKNIDGSYTYYDSGAHRKFYNMDTPTNPSTMASNILLKQDSIKSVELHEKVSGSQILCLVAPASLQEHFLFMFFSKRGTSNIYSDLACVAFRSYVESRGLSLQELYQTLINRGVTSMTFEVMGVDRHVSMDTNVGSLIMHGISLSDGSKMPMDEVETFATGLGFDVVKLLFRSDGPNSFAEALKVYENYDCRGNTNEGGVMTINYADYTEKLKCKTYWYLYLREFRQSIPSGRKSEVVPTLDGTMSRLKMFGVPENDHLNQMSQHYVLWWLWVRSNQCTSDLRKILDAGDHPLVIDHFLALEKYSVQRNYASLYNELLADQRESPSLVPLGINVGVMGSGKSSVGKMIAVTISQDQCGGEAVRYLMDGSADNKILILDRTNLTTELRSSLLWDLGGELGRSQSKKYVLLVPFFIGHTTMNTLQLPPVLIDRFLKNRRERESHESLTIEGTGMLTVMEILRNASRSLVFPTSSSETVLLVIEDSIDNKVNAVKHWLQLRYPQFAKRLNECEKTYDKFGSYPLNNKMRVMYAGYSTPHHDLVSNPQLGVYFEQFLKRNPGATEHNSHITIAYGADKVAQTKWIEGNIKNLSWIGTFEQEDQVCGSIVLDVDPKSFTDLKQIPKNTLVYHVTGWTASGIQPVQSNKILNTVTGTSEEKPILGSLLKLFENGNVWQNDDKITLKLFDTVVPVRGYEGTYRRK
jgi:hypothetical protein